MGRQKKSEKQKPVAYEVSFERPRTMQILFFVKNNKTKQGNAV